MFNKVNTKAQCIGMSGPLDLSMDSMEETRFKKRNQYLIEKLEKRLHFSFRELECILLIYYKIAKEGKIQNPQQVRLHILYILR